ncbi:uncharacterized protein BYT42DRAFT_386187 [Radiomyces spectabilis]|uniref:uncharacterized protein n=1 Tax=Radiomyces spectabilis TaxID=64574 RepID=UPI0022209560|nr:uncharacterized protein BYT42DRAFT_386187 [Radiomyces spectabilis]KAI8376427.1 hypothetical protein BYT42DRAFT_386187 [Radiomyces spectabilis]
MERLMPIQFECTTGAVIIGNMELRTMILLQVAQANGIWSTVPSRSSMDYYKSVFDLVLRKPQLSLKDNMDFTNIDKSMQTIQPTLPTFWSRLWKPLQYLHPATRTRQYGEMQHMHDLMSAAARPTTGLETNDTTYHEEYARVNNVIECSEMAITYYADYAGPVPTSEASTGTFSGIGTDIGNGGLPPEWGVRLLAWNAMIYYGPWTDRQRAAIQDYFFPNSHRNNSPTPRLIPGQSRMATAFKFQLEFMTEATLRIPTREKSKDWKYETGSAELDIGADGFYTRPYGWIDLKAAKDSSVKMVVPFVFGADGYVTKLDVHLKEPDVSTSINYASLLQLPSLELHVAMPTPLVWNAHRVWNITCKAARPRIFLLRDHIFLLQDLIKDWTSSPPVDLLHFIPTTYILHLDATQPHIYLCVNEHNVISNPNSLEDNAFLVVQAQKLYFDITLPLQDFEPEVNTIRFDANVEQCKIGISLQTSHTLNAFMQQDDAQVAVCLGLKISGSYEYYTSIDVATHIESTSLYVTLNGVTVKLFGTVIRYLFILRDNYFGNWINFWTIEEYRYRRQNPQEYLEMKKKQGEAKPVQDPFEVYVFLEVLDGALMLPENLYECSHYSQLEFQELQLELRNLDIYMDMHVNISPITWTRDSNPNPCKKQAPFRIKNARDPRNFIFIDETSIYAHRLFGPLPETATYLCHWEFDIGHITGEIKPSFLLGTMCFAQTFVYNLIDEDNAVPAEMTPDPDPDVTFVKASVREIDIYLMSQNTATGIHFKDGMTVDFDNLVNEKYCQRIAVKLPAIETTCLANQDPSKQGNSQESEFSWVEVAKVELGLNITLFRQTKDWQQKRSKQQTFISSQDYFTRRCVNLYDEDNDTDSSRSSVNTLQEHHVGILYAPPYRSFYCADKPTSHIENASSAHSTHSQTLDGFFGRRKSSTGSPSISSFVGNWSPTYNTDDESDDDRIIDHVPMSRTSMRSSVLRDNESFHTANSEGIYSTRYSEMEISDYASDGYGGASVQSMSDMESEVEDTYPVNDVLYDTTVKNAYTPTSIPPSIPYSGYLKRYSVQRAIATLDRSHPFFHPFLAPPKTSVVPEKKEERYKFENDSHIDTEYFFKEHNSASDDGSDGGTANKADESKGNEVLATTVIEATCPVTILLTPILVKVVQELTEVISKDDWDLETMLDSHQIEYIGQLTRYLTHQYICTRFAVLLPRTYLHFIQNVMIPDDLPIYKHGQSHIKTQYDFQNTILCSADVFLQDFRMIGSVKFQDLAFDEKQVSVAESKLVFQESRVHIDTGKLGCKVRYISERHEPLHQPVSFGIPLARQHQPIKRHRNEEEDQTHATNELVVVDLELSDFAFKWLGAQKPNYFNMEIGGLSTIIITESVEILVGAVYSWLVFVDDLKDILESFQERRSRQIQVFIHELANFSNDPHVVGDPLFLTKPTNMLRLGSRNFRNDVGWKLLARMRHILRSMPSSTREELQYRLTSGGAIQHVDSRYMFSSVVQTFSRWRSWEISDDDIAHCRLFTQPFNQRSHQESSMIESSCTQDFVRLLTSSVNLGKITLQQFGFCIYEEEEVTEDNSIFIRSIELALDSVFKRPTIGDPSDDVSPPRPSSDDRAKTHPSEGYLDVVAKGSVASVKIGANPAILAFARHMLMVQRVFTNKIRSLSHTSKATAVSHSSSSFSSRHSQSLSPDASFDLQKILAQVDIVAQVLVDVHDIDICARAQKLTMQSVIRGIQGSALLSNPRLTPTAFFASSERADSDTGSGVRSSFKTSRKNMHHAQNRILLEAAGGVDLIDVRFFEMQRHRDRLATLVELLVITMDHPTVNANLSQPARSTKKGKSDTQRQLFNLFCNVRKFYIHAPQSLLRLYGFVEEWRTEQGQRYHFMFQNLLNEWEEQRKEMAYSNSSNPAKGVPLTGRKFDSRFQVLLNSVVARADLLPSLSVEYSMEDLFALAHEIQPKGVSVLKYAIQLSKQELHLITKNTAPATPSSTAIHDHGGTVFAIPSIRSTGSLRSVSDGGADRLKLRSMISVDFISLSLNVAMIDSLLTAQSLLGNEISELLEVLSYSKQRHHEPSTEGTTPASSSGKPLRYHLNFLLDGLRISASSPSALVLFESNALEASVSNDCVAHGDRPSPEGLAWKVQGRNFALSLDHNSGSYPDDPTSRAKKETFSRRNRLAYIVIDFLIQNYLPGCSSQITSKDQPNHPLGSFYIDISKIQTVMQPIALGKLAEIYIYYDAELKKKRELKKLELERLAANTKRLVQSFKYDTASMEEDIQSLWQDKLICLRIQKLGVAIPLDTQSHHSSSARSPKEVSALLFSIVSLELLTQNIETSTAVLENISLQCVKRFDQSNEDHFVAEKHSRMNQMLLPSIVCKLYAQSQKSRQSLKIDAKVGGFEVDLDGTIADYINSLNDIYIKSMDRVNEFAVNTKLMTKQEPEEKGSEVVNLEIIGVFEYQSGVVRMYPKRHSGDTVRRKSPKQSLRIKTGMESLSRTTEGNVATLKLPGLNAWMIYQTSLGAHASGSDAPRRFHGDILIHESNNILHPSLVQFLREVVAGLKLGMQESSERKAERSTTTTTTTTDVDNLDASVLVRLSRTKLDLSCQPTSKVVCSLGWDQSQFLLNAFYDPAGTRVMSCVASIHDLSTTIKHHFSPEACLTAKVDELVFNVTLMLPRDSAIHRNDDISVVVNIPCIHTDLNVRHLQDLLTLYACWFNQAIVPDTTPAQADHNTSSKLLPSDTIVEENDTESGESASLPTKPFAKHIAVHSQTVNLSVDMGQAIGKIALVPNNVSMTVYHVPMQCKGLSFSFDHIDVSSEGRLSGDAQLQRVLVNVSLKVQDGVQAYSSSSHVILDGARATFEYEYQNILDLVQDPIELTSIIQPKEGQYEMTTSIHMRAMIVRLSIKTVPVIITMYRRFMELLEKKKMEAGLLDMPTMPAMPAVPAAPVRENVTTTQPTQSTYTSSAVSAEARKDSPALQLVHRHVHIQMDGLDIVIYPNQFHDVDNVEVHARQINANLSEAPTSDEGMHRVLTINLLNAALLKNVSSKDLMAQDRTLAVTAESKTKSWGGTRIFTIPTTRLTMDSNQISQAVDHTFAANFDGRVNVSLNLGLMKYLQEMYSMYKNQLERAKESELARPSPSTTPGETNAPSLAGHDDTESVDSGVGVNKRKAASLHRKPSSASTDPREPSDSPEPDKLPPTGPSEAIKYRAVQPVDFYPQLQVMGDATPPMEWLGLKRDRLPAAIHENITLPLDGLVQSLWKTFEEQCQ